MIHSKSHPCSAQTRPGKLAVALTLVLLLLSPLHLVAQSGASQQTAGSLNFLVISDWGGKGGTTQRGQPQMEDGI